ncbi:MAG TPA: cytochrome c family protein [Thermoguttaceae bacterium]|nr:cytochrome c family protein [Thermoguttaceae bacterium]
MSKFSRTISFVACVALVTLVAISAQAIAEEPAPPEGQTYVGAKDCASCHFKQFLTWSKTKHAKSFDLLPESYQTNAECLHCHSTGFGTDTGFTDKATTPTLVGTGCEVCHGPGSKHAEIAKGFGKEKLTDEQEQQVRDAIWRLVPKNICIECHTTQGHQASSTPKELQAK